MKYTTVIVSPSYLLFEPFQIPCSIHSMEPHYAYLDRCSSVVNSSSAVCTLLDLELVTISANYCRPAVNVTSAMPSISRETPAWQWQGWQHVVCNATTDIHGSRLPVAHAPQDTGCDFPHVRVHCYPVNLTHSMGDWLWVAYSSRFTSEFLDCEKHCQIICYSSKFQEHIAIIIL